MIVLNYNVFLIMKNEYIKPSIEVLSLTTMQETLQTYSTVLGIAPLLMQGSDMDTPSDLSGEDYTSYFN